MKFRARCCPRGNFHSRIPRCWHCFSKSRDAEGAAPSPNSSAAVEVAFSDEKAGERTAGDEEEERGEEEEEEAIPKSILRKANSSFCHKDRKTSVKWMDLIGKELVEVTEFEPSDAGDSLDDEDFSSHCSCTIQ